MDQTEISEFINSNVPLGEVFEDGFLEITKQTHYENINSRVYQFFLDNKKNGAVAQLFYRALRNAIKHKTEKYDIVELFDFSCITEVAVNMNDISGRIDIVIEDTERKSVIIIENKIYHHLDNPLNEYYQHFEKYGINRIPILLTLENTATPKDTIVDYVNIRHIDWISEIEKLGVDSDIPNNYQVYIQDFINSIKRLTKLNTMNEQINFYFKNVEKIKAIKETESQATQYVVNQISGIAQTLNLDLYGNGNSYRSFWDEKNHKGVYYTVWFEPLLNGENHLYIIIELDFNDNCFQKHKELSKSISCKAYEGVFANGSGSTKYTHHLFYKKVEIDQDKINDLKATVSQEIAQNFEPIMKEVVEHCYPNYKYKI